MMRNVKNAIKEGSPTAKCKWREYYFPDITPAPAQEKRIRAKKKKR
jgi:hypothetical protein